MIQNKNPKICCFYNNKLSDREIYSGIKKNKLLRNKFNQGGETPVFQKL